MGKRTTTTTTVVLSPVPLSSGPRQCGCGCGKTITNEMQACYPVFPWDPAGAPRRTAAERCANHTHCAYRDDDPTRCPCCHGKSSCTCVGP